MPLFKCSGSANSKLITKNATSPSLTVRDGSSSYTFTFDFPNRVIGVIKNSNYSIINLISGNTVTMRYYNGHTGWESGTISITAIGY